MGTNLKNDITKRLNSIKYNVSTFHDTAIVGMDLQTLNRWAICNIPSFFAS